MISRARFIAAVALALAAASLAPRPARAGGCGPADPDCRRRLHRALTGARALETEVGAGVRFGSGPTEGAIRFSTRGLSLKSPEGDFSLLSFEALYLPEAGGFRLRVTAAESEALFFCSDAEGATLPPMSGVFGECRPDGMWAVGGSLLTYQRDVGSEMEQRWAARWAELHGVLNFLRNGNGVETVRKRLQMFLGASAETAVSRDGEAAGALRAHLAVSGLIRSRDNRWEAQGYAGFRPDVTEWDDWGAEARVQVLRHVLLGRQWVGSLGAEARYSHWSVPWRAIGDLVTAGGEPDSLYVGLMFGLRHR